jgi:hypothetical protein
MTTTTMQSTLPTPNMLVMMTSPTLNADGLDNAAIYIAGGNNNAALNAPIHYAVLTTTPPSTKESSDGEVTLYNQPQ